jgi:hypothetical protein
MTNMTSGDHYNAAEKLLAEAESYHEPDTRARWCLELAKIHLALSQASTAATALARHEETTATSGQAATAGSRGSTEPAIGEVTPVPANPSAHQPRPAPPASRSRPLPPLEQPLNLPDTPQAAQPPPPDTGPAPALRQRQPRPESGPLKAAGPAGLPPARDDPAKRNPAATGTGT